jgi:thiamine-monophosphate kinase
MLDISDGLVGDARHLAAASGVRLSIDAALVPVGEGLEVRDVLSSGEEYELLAALSPDAASGLLAEWPSRFEVPLTVIGRVETVEPGGAIDIGGVPASRPGGPSPSRVEFGTGHDHFTR